MENRIVWEHVRFSVVHHLRMTVAMHYQDEMLVSVSLFVNVWYYAWNIGDYINDYKIVVARTTWVDAFCHRKL